MMHKIIYCSLFFFLFSSACLAAEEANPFELPEIVVTASSVTLPTEKAGANIQVVTNEEIKKSGSTDIAHLLQKYSSAQVSTQPGNYSQVRIRGFNSGKSISTLNDQVLILIDGNRSGTGNLENIPLAGVERIEILRGAGSVLYGGSAVGGVINIITKEGSGKPSGVVESAGGSYGSFLGRAGVSGGVFDDTLGYTFAAETNGAQDYITGDNTTYKNSKFRKSGGLASVTYRPEDNSKISVLGVTSAVYDTGSPGDKFFATPNSKLNNNYGHSSLRLETTTDDGYGLWGSFYASNNVYKDNNREAFPYTTTIDVLMLGGKLIGTIPLGDVFDLSLGQIALGSEYLHTRQTQHGSSVFEPGSNMKMFSLFAEHVITNDDFSLQYGVRYDNYTAETKSSNSLQATEHTKYYDHLTAGANAVWWFLDGLGLQGSIGTAYVPPSPMQLAGEYSFWGTKYVPNPDLKAEKSLTMSAGIEFDKYGFRGNLGYFTTQFKDRIVSVSSGFWPNPVVARYENQGRQYASGLEGDVRYSYDFEWLNLPSTFTTFFHGEYFTERTNKGEDAKIGIITDLPEYKFSTGVGLELGKVNLELDAQYFGGHDGYDFSSREYSYFSGFSLYNAKVTVTPIDDLSVYLEVRNLADTQYGYKPEFPEPGRSFWVGARYEF